jgi:hypothetical protein
MARRLCSPAAGGRLPTLQAALAAALWQLARALYISVRRGVTVTATLEQGEHLLAAGRRLAAQILV